jgi:hypothetical protein
MSPLSAFNAAGLSEYVRRRGEIVNDRTRKLNEDVAFFAGDDFLLLFVN